MAPRKPKKAPAKKAAAKRVAAKKVAPKKSVARVNRMIGNQLWKLRSKHGRNRLFATPKLMWEAACEYFQWCDEHPFYESVVQKVKVTRDTEKIELVPNPKMQPYTLEGLCIFLGCNTKYFNDLEKSLSGKEDDVSVGFSEVVTRIREVIYHQKFTGAAAGFFKESIIALELGLKSKVDLTTNDESLNKKPDYSGLSTEELNTLLKLQKKISG